MRARLAIVCDFVEERWPSMDLVGEMVTRQMEINHSDEFAVTQVRLPMRRRFTRIPFLPDGLAFNADRLLNRFRDYPRSLARRKDDFDLFHVVDHTYAQLVSALRPERTVVTCHDLDAFRCLLEGESRPWWFRAITRKILDGLRQAARVICVSSATAIELQRCGLISSERIRVVPNGVHPVYSPASDPEADAEAARLLAGRASGTIWLLNVGSTISRKRIDVLLRAFAAVRKEWPEACLIRAGGVFTPAQLQLSRELGLEQSIVVLPFLTRPVLAAIYRRATLMLHTAEYEGFGLTLLEAMACGCPVVASDIPALREVGGTSISYCRVADIDNWKETAIHLVREKTRQDDAWRIRRSQALSRASGLSWTENARRTIEVYRELL